MAFFGNDAINRVNLHTGIAAFARGAGDIFFMAVLLKSGIPLAVALVAQGSIFIGRLIIRPLILPVAKRYGLKPLLLAGAIGMGLHYPFLPYVQGVGPLLYVVLAIVAVAEVLYFPTYHTYFATLGDVTARGRQIALREMLGALAGVVAPLVGTWTIVNAGPQAAFLAAAGIQASSVLPLLAIGNVRIAPRVDIPLRAMWLGSALMMLDGWYNAILIIWGAMLFVVLGSDYATYGGAMAAAGLVGAAYGLLIGHGIDAGRGRRAVTIAFTVALSIVTFRAFSLDVTWLALLANAAGALVPPLYVPVLATVTYNLSKAAPCPLRFNMALEAAWDIGCASGCIGAGVLVGAGAAWSGIVLLGAPALLIAARLLWQHYPARQAA